MSDPKPFYLAWQFWWQVLMLVLVSANWIYSWWTNREKVTGRRFADLEKEVGRRVKKTALDAMTVKREELCAKHHARTSGLELTVSTMTAEMRAMPGHANLNKLHGRVDAIQKELSTMNGRMEGFGRTLELINEFLLKEGNKR